MCVGLLLYLFYTPEIVGRVHVPPEDAATVYPWFLMHELPTGLAGLAMAGIFAIAQGSLDSAMNALASSIVADVWLPWKRRRLGARRGGLQNSGAASDERAQGPFPEHGTREGDSTREERASKITVAAVGGMMCVFAILCACLYDPGAHTLLDFALGLMPLGAWRGMLGGVCDGVVYGAGSSFSVVMALVAGAGAVVMLQDRVMGWWSPMVFGRGVVLAWPWWTRVGGIVSFLVCVCGRARTRDEHEPESHRDTEDAQRTDG